MLDLALNSDGDLGVTNDDVVIITGADAAAQAIRVQLGSDYGSFEFADNEGLRWDLIIGHRGDDLTLPRAELSRAISTAQGVASLDSLTLAFDDETGALTVDFQATADDGAIVEGEATVTDDDIDLLLWVV